MSCIWWMNLAWFIAGFWWVFAVGNYFYYRRRIRNLERTLRLIRSDYVIYRGPRQWNVN